MNPLGLIDIGANITHPQLYNQLDKVVENMRSKGISKAIITSSNLGDTRTALDIIKAYPDFFYTTVGYHPHNSKDFSHDDIDLIIKYTKNNKVLAIGECGLDYYREYSSKDDQLFCFEEQLEVAKAIRLPIFLHEREAHKDFVNTLKKHILDINKSVVHCFTGTKDELKTYLDMGCYIGITGWITDLSRGEHLHHMIKYIPEDKLMIETDAPYLTPKNIPFKTNGVNEPSHLNYVAQCVAECLNKDISYIKEITISNTKRFFSI
ncbi:MAG: TatD family hydrolase [Gammaproteobacteria bacterium]|jgi:TatD DNase family protein|nr:TatD family hydrolase [Gammaproteobacteria bacterium]MBT4462895.1 TatD family hydrolase [Gammaproteobacteria bacterium]MBT4655379.1 TatD family hydrolase [Gammaproteobacteria bacterium]MBT5116331.1 TatD family hydrolase [Gammaproteobacteria bacterium]MBT5761368.1 TatD family hydrolase [Gammaproteobacteria bacterium]